MLKSEGNVKMYDPENIFAKIIRKEIPAQIVYEDENILAFKDIAPVAPVHVLVVPKGNFIDLADFSNKASANDIANFFKLIPIIATLLGLKDFKIISNKGAEVSQTIFHFHVHIIGGHKIEAII